jgi:hypothetical protein
MDNQFFQLMRLALKRCDREINKVISLYLGMWVFIVTCGCFVIINMAVNFQPTITTNVFPNIAGTALNATILSLEFAFVNAVFTLTFFAIVICLFEYALNFTIVCYYYDNCSWETPKQINAFFKAIDTHFKKVGLANRIEEAREEDILKTEINKIKNDL